MIMKEITSFTWLVFVVDDDNVGRYFYIILSVHVYRYCRPTIRSFCFIFVELTHDVIMNILLVVYSLLMPAVGSPSWPTISADTVARQHGNRYCRPLRRDP